MNRLRFKAKATGLRRTGDSGADGADFALRRTFGGCYIAAHPAPNVGPYLFDVAQARPSADPLRDRRDRERRMPVGQHVAADVAAGVSGQGRGG